MKEILKQSRGVALTVVIFVVAILFTLTGATLLFSGLDLKITSALKTGTITFQVADAGVQHALAVIPAGTTFPYNSLTEVVPSILHPTIAGYSYSVTAVNTAGNSQAILTSTAIGPNGAKKVIAAYIGRGSYGLGATSLPGSPAASTETTFSGTSFSINGADNCNAAPAVPGIVVTDPALATEITNDDTSDGGLASNQTSLVTGAGGTPSVVTIPPLSQTVSEIADAYLNLPNPPSPPPTVLPGGSYSSNGSWGTSSSPRITRITGNAQIQGTIEGYGVLIVDGALDVQGNFYFHGLVIARGDIQVQFTGNAGIYGSVILAESSFYDPTVELDVRGNATIRFDSCALSSAEGWVPLPKKAKLIAWQEIM